MKHFVICRYNIGLYSSNPYNVSDPNTWMAHRLPKYERLVKSLKKQTNQHFQFVVGIDENTPDNFKDAIELITNKHLSRSSFKIVKQLPQVYLNDLNITSEWVITSRIDNDDAYSKDFIKTIQDNFRAETEVLDVYGVQIDENSGKRYTSGRFKPNSPFLSLVERNKGELLTAFDKSHSTMIEKYSARFAGGQPLSIQYIHDRNISNKIQGLEI